MKSFLIFILFSIIIIDLSPLYGQDSQLILLKSFPDPESEKPNDYLSHPYDLVLYKDYYIVTDAVECCLKVFSTEGELIRVIGSKGQGPGELLDPFVFTIDKSNGIIYCSDQGNRRISCFLVNGKFLKVVKSKLLIHDLEFLDGYLFTASYNKTNRSLFTMYDTTGKTQKLFGDFFDPRIERLPFGDILYKDVCLDVNNDTLYVFYERLPLIQLYDENGQLARTIHIKIKKVKKLYEKNIKGAGVRKKGGRIPISKWLFGAYVSDDKIYCYSPYEFGCILVLDHYGNLIDKIYFSDNPAKHWLIRQKLVEIVRNRFIFLDLDDAQVKIYSLITY